MELIPFEHTHLDKITPNAFGKNPRALQSISNPDCDKYTMVTANGDPLALIFFCETEPGVYAGFFVVSTEFRASHCVKLRYFVQKLVEEHNAKKVWTASKQLPELRHWHEFLGLHKTGEVEVEGETYDVWSMTWE